MTKFFDILYIVKIIININFQYYIIINPQY